MPLRILQLAAEVAPFAKTGGLGDVAAGLSRFLGKAGHDVRIFLPYYPSLRKNDYVPVDFIRDVQVQLGPHRFTYTARTTLLPESDVGVYFIDCPALFGRGGIYQGDRDDSLRFGLLSVAALESAQRMGWAPDILHCHDWHTALAPVYLKAFFDWDSLFQRTKTVLTIHNLGFQGIVDLSRVVDLGLEKHAHRLDLSAGHLNFMKNGILQADALTAVRSRPPRRVLAWTACCAPGATACSALSTAWIMRIGTRRPIPTSSTTTRRRTSPARGTASGPCCARSVSTSARPRRWWASSPG
jgi:starch synthase